MRSADRSPIEALILDWAGTAVDFGSLAPVRAFQSLFAERGIELSEAQVRGPMGAEKRAHIAALCQLPEVQQHWQTHYGRVPSEQDIDELFARFIPLQIAAIETGSQLIPGLLDMCQWAEQRKVAIAGNTGYARSMVAGLVQRAAEQGYRPASVVCADEVARGRPHPNMSLMNAMQLGVLKLANCVKIDDTTPGIAEGLNAGMWTIALAISGNEVGLSLEQWQQLPKLQQQQARESAYTTMRAAGAHYVIDSIAQVAECLEDIERRLERGERP